MAIGRRKAKYESCPRLLLEQAVALRHTARYAEFLRLFEPPLSIISHNAKHSTISHQRISMRSTRCPVE